MFITNIPNNMNRNTWCALVRVTAVNGNTDLGDATGAYVNVAYQALGEEDFVTIVEQSFKSFDFKVIEIEYIERGDDLFIANPDDSEKLILLNRILDGDEFAWGTFYTYLAD
jgi:hypothetical protein